MEFRNIKTFLCIAEMNSFSKAAEKFLKKLKEELEI